MIYSYYSLDQYIYINKKILSLLPCCISTNESARRAGCRLHECVRCRSLIDVTVRVSLLEEAWPYCSSLPRCPFTHMTYSVSHCQTHTHTHIQHCTMTTDFFPSPSICRLFPPIIPPQLNLGSQLQLSRAHSSMFSADYILVTISHSASKLSHLLLQIQTGGALHVEMQKLLQY